LVLTQEKQVNIFVLDQDITKAAQAHCDPHVSKLILETAQMLSTVAKGCEVAYGYKAFNPNHPCCKWAAQSTANYKWLKDLGLALASEFEFRYGNVHKSADVVYNAPELSLPNAGLTKFAQAMPDEYKADDAVSSYRAYYRGAKFDSGLLVYTNREPPAWLNMSFAVAVKKDRIVYTATKRVQGHNVYDWITPVQVRSSA
jgi:hypothetical protein